jgi:acetyl esterase/lipase
MVVMASPDNDGARILSAAPAQPDARITYGPDANQFGELRLPSNKKNAPLLIFIHGGYWRARYNLTHAGHLCAALAQAGVATLNIEYRRVGNAGGGWPGTFEDIAAARQYVSHHAKELAANFNVDAARLAVAGHSAGGALALWLAARDRKITAVASLAGVNDLHRAWELHLSHDAVVELLGGTPEQVREHYAEADPMKLAIKARQVLVHGSGDTIVPPEFSSRYVQVKSARERAELVNLKDAGHFDVIDPQSAHWPKVDQALTGLFSERR